MRWWTRPSAAYSRTRRICGRFEPRSRKAALAGSSATRRPEQRRHPSMLDERLTGFCRLLRERGLPVTPAASVDAMRALEWIDLGDRLDLYFALRSLLATRYRDRPTFDASFAEWWGDASTQLDATSEQTRQRERPQSQRVQDQRDGAGESVAL